MNKAWTHYRSPSKASIPIGEIVRAMRNLSMLRTRISFLGSEIDHLSDNFGSSIEAKFLRRKKSFSITRKISPNGKPAKLLLIVVILVIASVLAKQKIFGRNLDKPHPPSGSPIYVSCQRLPMIFYSFRRATLHVNFGMFRDGNCV